MKSMKKLFAGILSVCMLASVAGCADSTDNETTTTTPATTTTTAAPAAGGDETTTTEAPSNTPSTDPVNLVFSWWGGDSRHTATQTAVDAFQAKYPNITVETQFEAWTGWEDAMSTRFYAGTAPDMNQVNWNWLTSFSSDGSIFVDHRDYSDIIDLTQFDQASLDQCIVADKLQAIPVSMTGRIFYWNETTFEKAGVSTPTTLAELYTAATAFKENLGADYYPLVLGEFDRAILFIYYLESVYGKAWVIDGKLQYTVDEIKTGLQFFEDLEDAGVIPTVQYLDADGADSLDKNGKWIDGRYAGIFEWDSSASKFNSALAEGQTFKVGQYFADMGSYQGGFSKVSLALAISETSQHKTEAAMLIEFLLNDDEGTTILSSERGIPLSKKALANTESQNLLNALTVEANKKVLDWVQYPLDPTFENSYFKADPTGLYYEIFSGLSYGDYSLDQAAQMFYDGVTSFLG